MRLDTIHRQLIPIMAAIRFMTQVNYRRGMRPYTTSVDKAEHRFIEGTRLCEDSPSLKNWARLTPGLFFCVL